MNWYADYGKRIFDVGISLLLAFFLSPMIFLIAILIIAIDHRNPLFQQTRVGLNNVSFNLYKFRTMYSSSEPISLTSKDDKRVTKLGRILRKTSLDELPQLLNVMKGDMSLVGPRPELDNNISKYPENFPERLKVRPGITGLAQINGRNQLSFNDVLKYDLDYLNKIDITADFKILFKTIGAVLLGRGAY